MALINRDSAIERVISILKKLKPDQGVEVLSYKRNRGISLVLVDNDTVFLRERGYVTEEYEIPMDVLRKTMKTLVKREFPRSRKVRVYNIEGPEEVGRKRKKL
ncbi:MAG: hypothetical protein KAJ60_06335 [Desulfobulbaceae bacterium]|nr:hypothetical protein [Desulfobulbaceae bacterium]